jgi:hypothetical protein
VKGAVGRNKDDTTLMSINANAMPKRRSTPPTSVEFIAPISNDNAEDTPIISRQQNPPNSRQTSLSLGTSERTTHTTRAKHR